MMPSLAEIVFTCTLCDGPLIAWESDAGRGTDCPHCLKPLVIPTKDVEVVNKDTFCEPMGLRRILQEVRDSEWEAIRRKLQEAKTRAGVLEIELRELREEKALASAVALAGGSAGLDHLATLRQQLAEMASRSQDLAAKLAATKQQHEVALDRMRDAMEAIRAEVGPLREENAEMLRQLGEANEAIEHERQASAAAQAELASLKARHTGRRSMPQVSPVMSTRA